MSVSLSRVNLQYGTDTLTRNVAKGLPGDAALYPRRAQISTRMSMSPTGRIGRPFYLLTVNSDCLPKHWETGIFNEDPVCFLLDANGNLGPAYYLDQLWLCVFQY
jgi:hypothetical protein